VPSTFAQVNVVALQAPLVHTASATENVHIPPCNPSAGIAAPAFSLAWQA
jgi:hypothetical protein